MTCKECIHYYACSAKGGLFNEKDESKEMLCNHFKPKSRFVELPCEVGQTVYKIVCYTNLKAPYPIPVKIVGFHLGKFPDLRGNRRKEYLIGYDDITHSLVHLDIAQIGKTVFVGENAKEEAENALKEREKE